MNNVNQYTTSDPNYSVWVNASAGTGKTKALTDRVIRLLLNGVHPEKILCITFTNAAAAEMSDRVSRTLQGWAILPENELSKEIEKIEGSPPSSTKLEIAKILFTSVIDKHDSIKIYTIHSFCQYLLKRFPMEAGVAPNFSVLDEQEASEMTREAYRRLLSSTKHDPETKKYLHYLAKTSADNSINDIVRFIIHNRARLNSLLEYPEIKVHIYESLGIDEICSEEEIIKSVYENTNNGTINKLSEAQKYGSKADIERSDILNTWLENGNNFGEYYRVFTTTDDKPKQIKSIITQKGRDQLPESEEIIAEEQARLLEAIEKIRSLKIAFSTESVLGLAYPIIQIFETLKREASVMDYDDLIHKTHQLLNDEGISPWVMYKLDGGIDYILIDEAQDTSPIQWEIIRAVCDEFFSGAGRGAENRRIFVVGDEKQSIFSFQGADPKEFNKMHQYFSQRADESSHNWQTVSLQKSFRSTEAVLKTVDQVFSDESVLSSISQQLDSINHESSRLDQPGRVELWEAITSERDSDKISWPTYTEPVERANVKKQLAEKIADTVSQWISDNRVINTNAGAKIISPGDILILVRQRDELVSHLVKNFKRKNIKIAGVDRLTLGDYIAVMDLISLGNFALLPEDNLNLATLLKSPLFNFSEEEIFTISNGRKEKSLWQSLKEQNGEPYKSASAYLNELIKLGESLSPFDYYNHVLEVRGGKKSFIARIGDEVIDPINEFLNLCLNFEKSHTVSLQKFIYWFSSGKREIKRDLEQGADAIRIMTTHASKGLQAPIVFLADTTSLPRNSTKVFWQEDGLFLWPGSTKNFNKKCKDLHKIKRDAEYDEYLRLLYVAMTRAADELYVCGATTGEPHPESWYKLIEKAMNKLAKKEDGKLVLVSGKSLQKEVSERLLKSNTQNALPGFATTSVPTKSNMIKADSNYSYIRKFGDYSKDQALEGTALHKLLETLPNAGKETQHKLAEHILKIEFPDIESPQNLIDRALKVIKHDKFQIFFGKNSYAEKEFSVLINGEVKTKRMDRIIINENEVLIVDYKSGSGKESSDNYYQQVQEYKSLIAKVYPDKKVTGYLLWIDNLKLEEVS